MLAATEAGIELLCKERSLREMFSLLKGFPGSGAAAASSSVAELKAAVWAVCSVAATPLGAALVERQEGVLAAVVAMAERAASYPLRGTAVYALSLVASTRKGDSNHKLMSVSPTLLKFNYWRNQVRASSPSWVGAASAVAAARSGP